MWGYLLFANIAAAGETLIHRVVRLVKKFRDPVQ